ncbi:MAG: D-aminoacylase [Gammaproteobacteria bacterium]|nr:D-aminoacylase [Gammaproteobacteria bacterium]
MICQEKDDGRADRRLPTPTHGRSLSPNRALRLCVSRPPRRVLPALALLLTACGSDDRAPVPDAEDAFVIHGATIVDGTGRAGFTGSARVVGGTIAEVVAEGMDGAGIAPRDGERAYDGSGLVLAPGFVDTHSHHDGGLLDESTALAAVSQGITTIVVGQDGGSPFPIADFFAALEAAPAAVNVASYAGHGTLRRQVMGDDFRREATPDEIASMQALLDTELASGVLGLSTGLEYDPGIYSTTEEVVALAGTAAARGGRYISHMRSEDRGLREAVEETIRIAERARLPVQISHFKLAARGLWGQAAEILARLDAARAGGLEITADVYPYEYWQSTMTVLFPERDFTDREAARFALEELVAPEGMLIGRFGADPELEGRTLARIAEERGTDPVTTYLDLIAESQAARAEGRDGGESIVATSMTVDDIAALMAWPHANVASDGGLRGAHPRGFGTYPRVLGRYVREERRLTLEEAVHKMTGLAAAHMGFSGRGTLEAGAAADLVLFDPATVIDRATTAEPHLTSSGIERVWVGGTVVYEGGAVTGARPGEVLRREQR